jgi:hypothetical protein
MSLEAATHHRPLPTLAKRILKGNLKTINNKNFAQLNNEQ